MFGRNPESAVGNTFLDFRDDFGEAAEGFVPIKTRTLIVDQPFPCDIYFPVVAQSLRNVTFEKIFHQGQMYGNEWYAAFSEQAIDEVYIREETTAAFSAYLFAFARSLITNSGLQPHHKNQVIYDALEFLVDQIFKGEPLGDIIHYGRELTKLAADFFAADRSASRVICTTFSRSYFTVTHSVQVSLLAMAFACHAGRRRQEAADFGLGALLHDIGKNQIDARILRKPFSLNDVEYAEIRKHPLLGYELLRESASLSSDQLELVLHHHEDMNGSGYPNGLKGYKIPYLARILRIIDCYDALTTKRPYKVALIPYKAVKIMEHEMKHLLDTALLRSFVEFLGTQVKVDLKSSVL
jgi:HD-GYP domain-containing protein (c-di-GMP phosphodiesterase class II)